uniref:Uncharacterized protein n=1 Tax=Arundo donax TaxID=35708 RepID=A0A0A8Y752_ARUDO
MSGFHWRTEHLLRFESDKLISGLFLSTSHTTVIPL